MRTFVNGTLKMTGSGYPPHNTEGVPMHNFPAPHIQKPADPSRMYILGDPRSVTIRAVSESFHNIWRIISSPSTISRANV